MKARSFSHVGITVSDFNKAVRFYWDVFGCPLVGVADTPPERVRSFFNVEGPQPSCKIGWIRVPGGAVLEIFEFQPQQPPSAIPWNKVGLTHISFNVRNLHGWYDYLVSKGVPFRSAHHSAGQAVQAAEKRGVELSALTLDELRAIAPQIGPDVYDALRAETAVRRRAHKGAPSPDRVREQLEEARVALALHRRWLDVASAPPPIVVAHRDGKLVADVL